MCASKISSMYAYTQSQREYTTTNKPEPAPGEVLVKVEFFGVTQEDVKLQTENGASVLEVGTDFSGFIVAINDTGSEYKVGDSVFGFSVKGGAYAEYVRCEIANIAQVPGTITMAEAATLPDMWLAAIQLLKVSARFEQRNRVIVLDAFTARGQACVMLAQVIGCRRVHAVVHSKWAENGVLELLRLQTALIDEVIPSSFEAKETHYTKALQRFDPKGVECVLDLRGQCRMQTGMIRPEGKYVFSSEKMRVDDKDWALIYGKGIEIHGSTLRNRGPRKLQPMWSFFVEQILPKYANGQLKFSNQRIYHWKDLDKASAWVRGNLELPEHVICCVTRQ